MTTGKHPLRWGAIVFFLLIALPQGLAGWKALFPDVFTTIERLAGYVTTFISLCHVGVTVESCNSVT